MPSTGSLVRTIPSSWKILCRGKGLQNALERKTDYESQNLKAKELRNCLERNSDHRNNTAKPAARAPEGTRSSGETKGVA